MGEQPTIIEKALSFQKLGGYVLSLKTFGLRLIGELGIGENLNQRSLAFKSLRFCRPDGKRIQEYSQEIAQETTNGAALVLRSELHEILYEAVRNTLPVRFGVHIASMVQSGREAEVTFSNGQQEVFDVVIIAEGLRSSTRTMLWQKKGIQPFGVLYSATSVDYRHGLDTRSIHAYLGAGKIIFFMPVSEYRTMIQSYFRGEASGHLPKRLLLDTFRSFSSRVLMVLEAIRREDSVFYDSVALVSLRSLFEGRVVFVGDAGYCPSFLSGMGASLALLGGKVLAQALAETSKDPSAAFIAYEEKMRPVISHFQKTAHANMNHLLSESRGRELVRNAVMRWLPPALVARQIGKQFKVEERLLEGVV